MAKVDTTGTTSSTMTLQSHIREARNRLFVVLVAFVLFSSLAYIFRDHIIYLLLQPLAGEQLSYLTPGGGFSFMFKVIIWTGIAASFPVAIYSLYKFITPTMPLRVRRYAGPLLIASSLLLVAGVSFGYIVAIPGAMNFLLTFADTYVSAMLTADSYLSFMLAYTLGLGVIFQIPLILLIVHWIKPLKPKQLLNFERYVIVGAFVIAAILTPTPDPANQAMIAAPMIALYQAGVATVSLSIWRERREQRRKLKTHSHPTSSVHTQPDPTSLLAPTFVAQHPASAIKTVAKSVATTATSVPQQAPRTRPPARSIDGVRVNRAPQGMTAGRKVMPRAIAPRQTVMSRTLVRSNTPSIHRPIQRLSVDGIRH